VSAGTIRHVETSPFAPDLFVTAEFERAVTVRSIGQRRRLSTFDTVLDFGGRRLTLVEDPSVLVAGAEGKGAPRG
jgi:hypothetical protein